MHGSLRTASCLACGRREPMEDVAERLPVPRCLECGEALKPDVVMFGEQLPTARSTGRRSSRSQRRFCSWSAHRSKSGRSPACRRRRSTAAESSRSSIAMRRPTTPSQRSSSTRRRRRARKHRRRPPALAVVPPLPTSHARRSRCLSPGTVPANMACRDTAWGLSPRHGWSGHGLGTVPATWLCRDTAWGLSP